jgi:hypothetical protein
LNVDPGTEPVLDPIAAAIRLGVTSELLFHYAMSGARTVDSAFRLPSRTVDGRTVFTAADRHAFDIRLFGAAIPPGRAQRGLRRGGDLRDQMFGWLARFLSDRQGAHLPGGGRDQGGRPWDRLRKPFVLRRFNLR